jgi:hypothetical protein
VDVCESANLTFVGRNAPPPPPVLPHTTRLPPTPLCTTFSTPHREGFRPINPNVWAIARSLRPVLSLVLSLAPLRRPYLTRGRVKHCAELTISLACRLGPRDIIGVRIGRTGPKTTACPTSNGRWENRVYWTKRKPGPARPYILRYR